MGDDIYIYIYDIYIYIYIFSHENVILKESAQILNNMKTKPVISFPYVSFITKIYIYIYS